MLATRASDAASALVYVNQVGGQDELVFDGASMVFDAHGELLARAGQFTEETLICDVEVQPCSASGCSIPGGAPPTSRCPWSTSPRPRRSTTRATSAAPRSPTRCRSSQVYEALVTGTRDYVRKNGFTDVAIALSGGIDCRWWRSSPPTLRPEHVHGVLMPSLLVRPLPGRCREAGGRAGHRAPGHPHRAGPRRLRRHAGPQLRGREPDVTEENLQSRIRGVVMMALSNKFRGWIVLTTGNKSEMAVGYSTLYGDTAGGFAVKDVPKLLVYELCRDRNARADRPLVPDEVLTKPPSAELRPDQRDDQSLPPYEVLDPIPEAYVEDDRTQAELVAWGSTPRSSSASPRLVDTAEYKRRQTPPGVRVTLKAFGKDRRVPITNRHRG